MATVQLNVPTVTSVGNGSVVGSVTIAGGSSNAQPGATYTAKACTNPNMVTGCVAPDTTYVPGTNFTFAYTVGNAATTYSVTLTANPSTGYLGSAASTPAVSGAELGQLNAPGNVTLSGGSSHGSLKVTFTAPTGTAPVSSYTVEVCTNKTMTTGCVTVTNYTSGAQITAVQGIVSGQRYFGEVTAITVGYLSATSAVSPAGNFGVTAT